MGCSTINASAKWYLEPTLTFRRQNPSLIPPSWDRTFTFKLVGIWPPVVRYCMGFYAHKRQEGYYYGAGNEVRTRDLNLGKVALYQLSYSRNTFLNC